MARRKVIEVICDRCGKTETQEPSQEAKAEGPELIVEFQGERKEYSDLCIRCRSACEGYFRGLTKQVEKVGKEEKAKEAPKGKPGLLSGIGRRAG
jgi:hypothetical protein